MPAREIWFGLGGFWFGRWVDLEVFRDETVGVRHGEHSSAVSMAFMQERIAAG